MNKFVILVVVVVVALVLVVPFAYRASAAPATVCVDSKERIVESDGETVSSKYLVFGDDEVFEVTDSLLFFKWDASDRYRTLREGQCYDVTAAGWRIPFFSAYRNIVKVDSLG